MKNRYKYELGFRDGKEAAIAIIFKLLDCDCEETTEATYTCPRCEAIGRIQETESGAESK